ncbi:MAG: YqaJ viral recombinase family protein [Candidatus Accumulibacter sp. UW25]|jgi:putative phage-type endonuclease
MTTIVKLVQGSPEWHEHRAKYRNASETAVVMGASPWQTPYQLWELRTGRRQPEVNAAMARGTALEPQARAAYEALTGHVMQPLVLVDGAYSASLDGLTFDGELIVEIKCPVKGRTSTLWKAVAGGEVPPHYDWQIEHQLMVSKATMAHLYVFDGEQQEGILIEVTPDPEPLEADTGSLGRLHPLPGNGHPTRSDRAGQGDSQGRRVATGGRGVRELEA